MRFSVNRKYPVERIQEDTDNAIKQVKPFLIESQRVPSDMLMLFFLAIFILCTIFDEFHCLYRFIVHCFAA